MNHLSNLSTFPQTQAHDVSLFGLALLAATRLHEPAPPIAQPAKAP